jgi:hypothetical protein
MPLHCQDVNYQSAQHFVRVGQLLHIFLTIFFDSLMKDPTVSFRISSFRVCLWVLLRVLLLPRHGCRFMPRSCVPLLHSGFIHHLFLNVSPLGASGRTSQAGPAVQWEGAWPLHVASLHSVPLWSLSFFGWPLTLLDTPMPWFLTFNDWPPSLWQSSLDFSSHLFLTSPYHGLHFSLMGLHLF